MNRLIFHDTTLRDGDQTPGVNFSVSQKTEIARELVRAGVNIIEAGFAAASPGDFKAIQSVVSAVGKQCGVSSLARANRADIDAVAEALKGAKHPRIHVFLSTSALHMRYKLKMTEEEVLCACADAVSYAKTLFEDVQFSAEDATRSDKAFLKQVFLTAAEAGATTLNIPDTVGAATPEEFAALVRTFTEDAAFDKVTFSVHCHNDLGLGVANTLAGIAAGALQVESTVGGLGERAGNAAFEQIVMALETRKDVFNVAHNIDTRRLIPLSRTAASLSGIPTAVGAPIIGKNAFSHESGIHQHGMLANEKTYQVIDPTLLGLKESTLLLGKLSGRAAFRKKAQELGYSLEKESLERAFNKFLELADRKKLVRDEEVDAILAEEQDAEILAHGFQLHAFAIQSSSVGGASADITLKKDGKLLRDAATGSGPIEASFHAVERITSTKFDLDTYRIRAVTEGTDALGIVQVKVRSGDASYAGRGVSMDIIEASIKAYVNAVNRASYYTEESAQQK